MKSRSKKRLRCKSQQPKIRKPELGLELTRSRNEGSYRPTRYGPKDVSRYWVATCVNFYVLRHPFHRWGTITVTLLTTSMCICLVSYFPFILVLSSGRVNRERVHVHPIETRGVILRKRMSIKGKTLRFSLCLYKISRDFT